MLDIARCQEGTCQHIDLFVTMIRLIVCYHQHIDHGFDRQRITALHATGKIRRIHRHDRDMAIFGMIRVELFHQSFDIGALRLGQTCGCQTNQRRFAFLGDRTESLYHILIGIHHRGDLIHRRGLQRNRLAKMAHKIHFAKCSTTL